MLWRRNRKEIKRTVAECQQDEWLWERVTGIQENPATAVAQNAEANTGEVRNLEALAELSDAVREAHADDEQHMAHEAQVAFAPIHSRLMDVIEASKHETSRDGTALAGRERTKPFTITGYGAGGNFTRSSRGPFERSGFRLRGLQWAVSLSLLFFVAVGSHEAGRMRAKRDARDLPVQSLVDDFEAGLHSPSPFEFIADKPGDNQQAARWLSQRVGTPIQLPSPSGAGVQLLGARRHTLWDRPVAQTHYLKNGVRLALYQVREPRCGLSNMDEVQMNGQLFLTANRGAYRVVAWRSGEVVMTMVSPLAMNDAVQLADALRNNEEPVV